MARGGGAWPGVLVAITLHGAPRHNRDIGERAIMIVVIEDAGGAVASHKNIRPPVVVVVERGNAEAVMSVGLIDVRFRRYVFKHLAEIVVQHIFCPRQPAWPAHNRNTLPNAGRPLAR